MPFSWQIALGLFTFALRTITQNYRHPDIRPYGNTHRRNCFYLVSSESPVCYVISCQSLCRFDRQYLYIIYLFPPHVRRGLMISLCMYPTDRLTTCFHRGLNSYS
ncbi:hypothetical protein DFH29DRAFT_60510 [Suillus ampliporus]|nr:hypothetical protein DFH29DRAFT_60510 [Suillus ampliporus]